MSTKMQQQVSCNDTKPFVTFLATLGDKNLQRKELGAWLKLHREKANLSQQSAAEKSKLSRYQWIRIENGQSGTKRETLIDIAAAINADVNKTLKKGGYSELFVPTENRATNIAENGLTENSYEILEDVFITFKNKTTPKTEQEQMLTAMRLVAAGVKAQNQGASQKEPTAFPDALLDPDVQRVISKTNKTYDSYGESRESIKRKRTG